MISLGQIGGAISSAPGQLRSLVGGSSSGGLSGALVFHHTLDITVDGKDVTHLFPPVQYLSFKYEDCISFRADTIDIISPDIGDQLIKSKFLKKGVDLRIKIHQWSKDYPTSHVVLDTGACEIDIIEQSGPPTEIKFEATSIPISGHLKLTWVYRIWEAVTLKDLVEQVAKENGLTPDWQVPPARDILISTVTQNYEADLTFLSKLVQEHALSLKVIDKRLVVFDEQAWEQRPAVYTFDFAKPGAIELIRWHIRSQSQDIYSAAEWKYFDPQVGSSTESKIEVDPTHDTTGSGETAKAKDFLHYKKELA